jgi:Zn-dependent protease with chaperone function
VAIAFLAFYAFYVWGGILWCWRKLRLLGQPPERLTRIVSDVGARMHLRPSRVWLLRSSASNAFAFPPTGELLFSERLLERHPDEEIAAICAHELGHLSETKTMVGSRLLGNLLIFFPWLFIKPLFHAWGVPAGAGLLVFSVLAARWSRSVSQRLEVRADKIAHTELDAANFARALERLYEDNLMPATMPRKNLSHPDLYDRLLSAGIQPTYERPKKPSKQSWNGGCLAGLIGIIIVLRLMGYLDNDPERPSLFHPRPEQPSAATPQPPT